MIALLLDHLWQSSIFAGGAGLLTLALRSNSANVRFWLWFAASAKFLVPFAILAALGSYVLTPITPPLPAPTLVLMEPVAQPFAGPKPVLAMTNLAAAPATAHLDLSLILLAIWAIWAIGFLAISVRWIVRWRQLRLLLREAAPSPLVAPIAVKFSASRLEPGPGGHIPTGRSVARGHRAAAIACRDEHHYGA
jgi:bla regulator protein blaR1